MGKLISVQPVLPTKDVVAGIAFYVKRLGFQVAFQDHALTPHYAGLRRDGVELHLQWHDSVGWERIERPMLRMVVEDLDELFAELGQKGVFHKATAIRAMPWGAREFAFFDPSGNGLTFYCDRA
jgi:catechol 2,3-dioxygenase-like lactoylglutathione lyase family enzyme